MKRILTLIFVVGTVGCTLSDGDFFAVVDARIEGEIDVGDRETDGEWIKLASSYELRIDSLTLDTGDVLLSSAQAASSFDPANPPEGYSLCHNGHCHGPDGSLVDYEDISAMLGSAGAVDVLALHLESLDYEAAFERALECEPECGLRTAQTITGMRIPVLGVTGTGAVRDGRVDPRIDGEQPWAIDLVLEPGDLSLTTALTVPLGRGEGEVVELDIRLPFAPKVFDAVAWADSPVADGGLDLSDTSNHESLVLGLQELPLSTSVTR